MKTEHGKTDDQSADLQILADLFGRRGLDWIVRCVGALPVAPGSSTVVNTIRQMYADARERFAVDARAMLGAGADVRLRGIAWSLLGAIGEASVDECLTVLARERDALRKSDEARTRTVDEIKRMITDLDVSIARRRGHGLGAEPETFDMVDRLKTLRQVVTLLESAK